MTDHAQNNVSGVLTLSEIREFASFSGPAQRYIRMSLDVAFDRDDAVALWSRDDQEEDAMAQQKLIYSVLTEIKDIMPTNDSIGHNEGFFSKLITVTAFDLSHNKLDCFAAYRFLYERLLGPNTRPWLPAAFCAAASLPNIEPSQRKILLQSISEAAATAVGWSRRAPSFFPE